MQVLGPDVNHSLRSFAVQGNAIRFGLGGIKNVGDNAIDRLIAEREANGLYTSITDFCRRVDSKVVNKRLLESLFVAVLWTDLRKTVISYCTCMKVHRL